VTEDRRAARPAIIASYWYSFDWDVEAIWQLDLPTRSMAITDLIWHLDVPVWNNYRLTPRAVLNDPVRHAGEHARMLAADLSYPIDVFRFRSRWMILDGIHRLLKAHTLGHTAISVRDVPEAAIRYR
jgi:hypothetical protein